MTGPPGQCRTMPTRAYPQRHSLQGGTFRNLRGTQRLEAVTPVAKEALMSARTRSLVGVATAGACIAALALSISCSSPSPAKTSRRAQPQPQNELAGAPAWIQRGCAAYWADAPERGVCGVGSASGSRNIALTTSTAEGRGRTAIARTLDSKVQAMLKDYQATTTGGEEFGSAAADEQHIVDVSKQLTNGTLSGAERRDLWISPSGVVYALMVLDLEKFQGAVWSMKQLSESVRSHVAQQAAKEFEGASEPVAPSPVSAGPIGAVLLVTAAQLAAMPSDTPVGWGTREEDPNGPVIRLDSPQDQGVYEGPFPIKVAFEAGPLGHPVDMETLRLEYKKAWGIDITDRVRAFIDGTQIDVAESELPVGRHTVEIQIEDVEGHESRRTFTVTVK